MVEVIDNFLPQDYFDNLCLMIDDLPWFYHDWSVYRGDDDPQFYHLFYFDGKIMSNQFFKYVEEVYTRYVPNTEDCTLYRMKINGTSRGDNLKEKKYHVDVEDKNHKVCILYMNTNNGYTSFEETGEKVDSIANRAVIFPGHMKHTGTNCTDEGLRVVLNIDFLTP